MPRWGRKRAVAIVRKRKPVPKQVKTYVKKAIQRSAEHKIIDTNIFGAATSPAGSIYYLCPALQGDLINNRSGDEIKPLKLEIYSMFYDLHANDVDMCRLVVFAYNGAVNAAVVTVPTFVDILQDETATGPNNAAHSHYNMRNKGNYHILWDKCFTIVGNDAVLGLNNNKVVTPMFKKTINLSKKMGNIRFNGTGATSASSGKNALYALIVSENGHAVTNTMVRLTYSDI